MTFGDLPNVSELSFLICKMGILILTELSDMRENRDNKRKYTAQDSEPKRLSVEGSDYC